MQIIFSPRSPNGKRGVCVKHVFQRRRHYFVEFIKSSQAFAAHLTKEISVKINQENTYYRGLDLNMKFVSKLFSGMDAPHCREPSPRGGGGFPALPRKNDQNCGEVAGQNKGPNFNFLQQQNNITTLNNAQSGLSIGYARESKK